MQVDYYVQNTTIVVKAREIIKLAAVKYRKIYGLRAKKEETAAFRRCYKGQLIPQRKNALQKRKPFSFVGRFFNFSVSWCLSDY